VTLHRWVSSSSATCPSGCMEPFTQLSEDRIQDYTAVRTSNLANETFIVKVGRKPWTAWKIWDCHRLAAEGTDLQEDKASAFLWNVSRPVAASQYASVNYRIMFPRVFVRAKLHVLYPGAPLVRSGVTGFQIMTLSTWLTGPAVLVYISATSQLHIMKG
jgi:hypothetical protein